MRPCACCRVKAPRFFFRGARVCTQPLNLFLPLPWPPLSLPPPPPPQRHNYTAVATEEAATSSSLLDLDTRKGQWAPKLTTFKAAEATITCKAVQNGQFGGGTAFGNCPKPTPPLFLTQPAGGCGCSPGYAPACPPGSSIVSCSATQNPTVGFGPGADWTIGTSLIVPEKGNCIAIWVNTAPAPRESTMTVAAVCSKIEKGW